MLALAGLLSLAAIAMAVILVLAVVGVLFKIVFKIALFPLFLGIGLIKGVVLSVLTLVGVLLMAVVGPVLLTVAALAFVPLAILGALTWTGFKVAGAVL